MAEGAFAEKTEEQLLEEVRALVVRSRALATYPDVLAWNARKCAEVLLVLHLRKRGLPVPNPPELEKLLKDAKLPGALGAQVRTLQNLGNAAAHFQKELDGAAPSNPRSVLLPLQEAISFLLEDEWPDTAAELKGTLAKLEQDVFAGSAGPGVDWVQRVIELERDLRDTRTAHARDKNALGDHAQVVAEHAQLRAEAEKRSRVLAERVRFLEHEVTTATNRPPEADRHLLELTRRLKEAAAERDRERAAREEVEATLERLRAASTPGVATHPESPRHTGSSRSAKRATIGGFVVGVAIASSFALVYAKRSAGVGSENATSESAVPVAAPSVPAATSSSAPAGATQSAQPVDDPIDPAGSSSTPEVVAPTTVDMLRISTGSSSWKLGLPLPLLESARAPDRHEVVTTDGLTVRLYACASDKWQVHRDRPNQYVSHKDHLSFTINGADKPHLFIESCRVGMQGPHVCVRVLYPAGREKDGEAWLKKIKLPTPA